MSRLFIGMFLFFISVTNSFAQTFDPDVLVDSSRARWSQMAVDSEGNVGVVWISDEDTVNFARSTDGGLTWQKTFVRKNSSEDYAREWAALAFDPEGNPWVAWYHSWVGFNDAHSVLITHSLDQGITFESSRIISAEYSTIANCLAIDENGNIYLPSYIWWELYCNVIPMGDYEKLHKTLVTPPSLADRGLADFLAVGRDTIFIVFAADSNDWSAPKSIYFTKSTDRGSTFAEPVLVSEEPLTGHFGVSRPTLVVDESNTIYAAWDDDRTGEREIYLAKSFDGGASFSEEIRVTEIIEGGHYRPNLAYHKDYGLYLLYQIGWDDPDIAVVHSVDGGTTFEERVLPGDSSFQHLEQHFADMAIDDSGHLYVSFQESRHGKSNLFVTSATVQPTEVKEDEQKRLSPEHFRLSQNYPNPFNAQTTIELDLPSESFVTLNIYNILGEKVRTLIKASVPQGRHSVTWDGRNDQGNSVTSGVYLYKLEMPQTTIVKKLLLLR